MAAPLHSPSASTGRRISRVWGLVRLIRHRLIIPILRSRHPPEYTARGVMVGLVVALTPTVGIQIPMVFLVWLAARCFWRAWDFNLLVALAWTLLTNVFTAPPFYYLFLVTGRLLLGRWDRIRDYGTFSERLSTSLGVEASWLETLWIYTYNLFAKFGVPMFVGSLPWALLGGWLGYVWTLGLIRRMRARRARDKRAAETQGVQ